MPRKAPESCTVVLKGPLPRELIVSDEVIFLLVDELERSIEQRLFGSIRNENKTTREKMNRNVSQDLILSGREVGEV